MTTERSGDQLLVLCQANVCRSVYGQVLLSASLPQGIRVRSAGLRAATGSQACAAVRERCQRHGRTVPDGSARQCTVDDLTRADLVLVMTRELQDDVARLLLAARAKTFTLPTAAAAAEEEVRRGSSIGSLAELTDALHKRRGGILQPPAAMPRRRFLRPRPVADPWEIPDGHIGSRRDHREALDLLESQCERLAKACRELWQPAQP